MSDDLRYELDIDLSRNPFNDEILPGFSTGPTIEGFAELNNELHKLGIRKDIEDALIEIDTEPYEGTDLSGSIGSIYVYENGDWDLELDD